MDLTDEELLHKFYAGDATALDHLTRRHNPILERIAHVILQSRTGSDLQALVEWDLDERLMQVWIYVSNTMHVNIGRWPNQRLSVLTWLVHLICLEMDRHLGFRRPF